MAALMMVPPGERAGVVASVERRIVATYGPDRTTESDRAEGRQVRVVEPPVQHDGYVEQVERTFEVKAPARKSRKKRKGA